MAYIQLLEDDGYMEELPERGMGYQHVQIAINDNDPKWFLAMNAEMLVKDDDYDEFRQGMAGHSLDEFIKEIEAGNIDQYYDEITEFDVKAVETHQGVEQIRTC